MVVSATNNQIKAERVRKHKSDVFHQTGVG